MGMRLPFACSVVRWTDGDLCEMNNPEPTWDWSRPLPSAPRETRWASTVTTAGRARFAI